MAYFIHNKYDKNSIAKVTTSDNINFTYNDDSMVTVIDYYGLLERGTTNYKELDTSSMGVSIIETLKYRINTGTQTGTEDITNNLSNNEIKTSLFDILMDIVGKIGVSTDLNATTIFGRLGNNTAIKKIQRGTVASYSYRTDNTTGNAANNAISISAVDPKKCVCLIDGNIISSSYTSSSTYSSTAVTNVTGGPTLSAINTNSLQFNRTYATEASTFYNVYNYPAFSWQLIEFN